MPHRLGPSTFIRGCDSCTPHAVICRRSLQSELESKHFYESAPASEVRGCLSFSSLFAGVLLSASRQHVTWSSLTNGDLTASCPPAPSSHPARPQFFIVRWAKINTFHRSRSLTASGLRAAVRSSPRWCGWHMLAPPPPHLMRSGCSCCGSSPR